MLSATAEGAGPDVVRERLVGEARDLFAVTRARLLAVAPREDRLEQLAASPASSLKHGSLALSTLPALAGVVNDGVPVLVLDGDDARVLAYALGDPEGPVGTHLLLGMQTGAAVGHVLVLAEDEPRSFAQEELELGSAFAAAAAAALAQLQLAEGQAVHVAQQAALARAAKSLNESLDLNRVLVRICHEAAAILDSDNAIVYRGNAQDGVVIEATYGMPPESIGYRMPAGGGLAGKVAQLDRPLITNDYQAMPNQGDATLFGEVRGSAAVPLHWDGELRGVLSVGYTKARLVTRDHLTCSRHSASWRPPRAVTPAPTPGLHRPRAPTV